MTNTIIPGYVMALACKRIGTFTLWRGAHLARQHHFIMQESQ